MGGSDMHFKTDTGKVYVRVNGDLQEADYPHFSDAEFREELKYLLRPEQLKKFDETWELDFAVEIPGLSRFRGNIYQQRGHAQAAFRVIPYQIQRMDDLQLPNACYDFIERPRGLVLVTGPAGSGKSTSLAAMVNEINHRHRVHIMTVEDPIEFVHEDVTAHVNQRELDVDTLSFSNALKYVLRQDPDVILVGEMRDLETIHLAITAAETGHLVFGTLHTVDAVQTIDRIVDVFPTTQQQQVRMQLSVNLVGVVSQSLVKRKDGRGRVAAFEVLVANSAVRALVRENKSYMIHSILQTGSKSKMQTLDQSLVNLYERGLVSYDDAKMKAKDPGEFARLVNISANEGRASKPTPGTPKAIEHERKGMVDGSQPMQVIQPKYANTPEPVDPTHPAPTAPAAPPVAEPTAPPPPAPGGVRGQPNRPQFKRD